MLSSTTTDRTERITRRDKRRKRFTRLQDGRKQQKEERRKQWQKKQQQPLPSLDGGKVHLGTYVIPSPGATAPLNKQDELARIMGFFPLMSSADDDDDGKNDKDDDEMPHTPSADLDMAYCTPMEPADEADDDSDGSDESLSTAGDTADMHGTFDARNSGSALFALLFAGEALCRRSPFLEQAQSSLQKQQYSCDVKKGVREHSVYTFGLATFFERSGRALAATGHRLANAELFRLLNRQPLDKTADTANRIFSMSVGAQRMTPDETVNRWLAASIVAAEIPDADQSAKSEALDAGTVIEHTLIDWKLPHRSFYSSTTNFRVIHHLRPTTPHDVLLRVFFESRKPSSVLIAMSKDDYDSLQTARKVRGFWKRLPTKMVTVLQDDVAQLKVKGSSQVPMDDDTVLDYLAQAVAKHIHDVSLKE